MNEIEALSRAAREIIGTRYKPHGRTPQEGMDCYGVVIYMQRSIEKHVPDVFYPDTSDKTNKRILRSLTASIPNLRLKKPEPGCVIEFHFDDDPAHVGVYLGVEGGLFVHGSRRHGVCIDNLARWRHLIAGYYMVVSK